MSTTAMILGGGQLRRVELSSAATHKTLNWAKVDHYKLCKVYIENTVKNIIPVIMMHSSNQWGTFVFWITLQSGT